MGVYVLLERIGTLYCLQQGGVVQLQLCIKEVRFILLFSCVLEIDETQYYAPEECKQHQKEALVV